MIQQAPQEESSAEPALGVLARMAAAATRHDTPCGAAGTVVWHEWGTGPALMLLHGGSGSWTHWIRNIECFVAAGYRVLAPDLPGSGDSAPPPDGEDADVIPRWLAMGLERFGLAAGGVRVIGFSFGSLVAALLARDYPQWVARLILVGPPVLPNQSAAAIGLRSWRDQPRGPLRDAVHRHNLLAFMLAHPESADALAVKLHGDNVERDRLTKRRLSRTSLMHDTMKSLAQPVDVIVGELDLLYRGRLDLVEDRLNQVPMLRSFTRFDQTGHWVPYESPERFNRCALDRLA